jgi:hypothetical protein
MHFASKKVPKRVKIEAKIDQKMASCQKNGFSLPYSKYNGFFIIIGVRDIHLVSSICTKIDQKTELDFEIVVWAFFLICWSFWGSFWEPKRDLRGDFWEGFLSIKNRSQKKIRLQLSGLGVGGLGVLKDHDLDIKYQISWSLYLDIKYLIILI